MTLAIVRRLTITVAVIVFGLAGERVAAANQKQVLVVYAAAREAQVVAVGDREIRRVLGAGLSDGVDYYSECIDQSRYEQGDYLAAFRNFLMLKFTGHRFDVVIAMDHLALEFVDRTRAELFPGTPVVFFSSRPSTPRPVNSTGVSSVLSFTGSLELAVAVQPEVRHVYVVSGADRSYEDLARPQFGAFEPRLSFTYLSRLSTEALEARLASLPDRSIVYYLHVSQDAKGRNFNPLEYLERLSSVARAPMYSWAGSTMGRGIVGGSLRSLEAQAVSVADLALRVLRGEAADGIPVASPDLSVRQVDWRQLRRWRISEARVPAGTAVLFEQPSVWDRYKSYILGAVALMIAQALLIAGLVAQHARRRQAEREVLGSEAQLRKSYDRIRDLAVRLLGAQETERARIARELHDDIGQQMTLLAIELDMLRNSLPKSAEGATHDVAARAQNIVRCVHDLSHRLHPARLQLIGLVAALEGLARELSQPEMTIRFTHEAVPTLPPDLALCLFRIAQEALQNAVRYSQATHVSVHVDGQPDAVVLTISDDGVGFDLDGVWGKGLGLISIAERVEAFRGASAIQSAPGAGTRIEVTLPVVVDLEAVPIPHSHERGRRVS